MDVNNGVVSVKRDFPWASRFWFRVKCMLRDSGNNADIGWVGSHHLKINVATCTYDDFVTNKA